MTRAAMTEARSQLAFTRVATDFDVSKSDFLVLTEDGVTTFEKMAYRLPTSTDVEDYLKTKVRVTSGYQYPDGRTVIFAKPTPMPWEAYKSGDDPGCFRKLWNLSLQIAKKELEALASPEEQSGRKVSMTMAQEMETRAIQEGMPIPLSDKERPSLIALTKVNQAYGPSGTFTYLTWESYLDREQEGRLRRAGKLPKDRQELVYQDNKVTVKSQAEEKSWQVEVEDARDLREVLDVRARAFHMTKVCPYETCRALTEIYLSKLRATQVKGMRGPTINELRRFDRELFEMILTWVAKSMGSIQAGLKKHIEDPTDPLWKLLDPQLATFPDQGLELEVKSTKRTREKSPDKQAKKPPKERKSPGRSDEQGPRMRMCIVCGRRHEPRCQIPPNFRKEAREKEKARKAEAKNRPGRKGKGGAKGEGTATE